MTESRRVTVDEVLRSWRANINFGDGVRLPAGERGVVCGKSESGQMVVILDDREAEPRKREVDPNTVFPIWWPQAQFPPEAEES